MAECSGMLQPNSSVLGPENKREGNYSVYCAAAGESLELNNKKKSRVKSIWQLNAPVDSTVSKKSSFCFSCREGVTEIFAPNCIICITSSKKRDVLGSFASST
jgi:hypothetical protein